MSSNNTLSISKDQQKRKVPLDVIVLIVKRLPSSENIAPLLLLNKSWYLVAYDALWGRISFSKSQNIQSLLKTLSRIPFKNFAGHLNRSKTLLNLNKTQSLDLSQCIWSKWNFFQDLGSDIKTLTKNLPNLKRLVLPPAKIHNPSVFLIPLGSKLEEIDLSCFLGDKNKSLKNLVRNIVQFCPNLKLLAMPNICLDPSLAQPQSLNELCKLLKLEEISFSHNLNVVHSYSSPIKEFFSSSKNLKKVKLQNLCCTE